MKICSFKDFPKILYEALVISNRDNEVLVSKLIWNAIQEVYYNERRDRII